MTDYFETLNKEQKEAVMAVEGPVMVFAGAGTGKTKTLIARIVHMINECNIEPRRILAITFTNKAAKEMRERIKDVIDKDKGYVNISTIHSLCARILRRNITKLGFKEDYEIIGIKGRIVVKDTEGNDKFFETGFATHVYVVGGTGYIDR